jgi:glycosyltransferase involved in cell wall biosynthesis
MRLAVMASHPIQYYAPIFRVLASRCDLQVFYAQQITPQHHSASGFGVPFQWDVDLLSGYRSSFLHNVSKTPAPSRFWGSDTPAIQDRLREGGFDALLVMGWYLKSFVQAVWAAKRLRIPVLVRGDSQLSTPRSPLKKAAKTAIYPPLLRMFDAALYAGHRSREYYRHYRYPESRLFFSPHCIDNDWFAARATHQARERLRAKLGIAPGVTALLFAGKLVPFKHPCDIIAAAARCRANGAQIELMVAGSGELEARMREESRKLRLPVHFLGFRNQTEMPEAYAAADLLALASNGAETWGLVASEALACGRPIVVSDACGCAPDLAADKKAGRVFPFGNIEGMSEAMEDIMAHPRSARDIADKTKQYSIWTAAGGILSAASFVTGARADPEKSLAAG